MSIKLINHRRRLLHKKSFHPPAERNRRNHKTSSKSRFKGSVDKKSIKKSKQTKKDISKREGLKVPYNYNHLYENFIFSKPKD